MLKGQYQSKKLIQSYESTYAKDTYGENSRKYRNAVKRYARKTENFKNYTISNDNGRWSFTRTDVYYY